MVGVQRIIYIPNLLASSLDALVPDPVASFSERGLFIGYGYILDRMMRPETWTRHTDLLTSSELGTIFNPPSLIYVQPSRAE